MPTLSNFIVYSVFSDLIDYIHCYYRFKGVFLREPMFFCMNKSLLIVRGTHIIMKIMALKKAGEKSLYMKNTFELKADVIDVFTHHFGASSQASTGLIL